MSISGKVLPFEMFWLNSKKGKESAKKVHKKLSIFKLLMILAIKLNVKHSSKFWVREKPFIFSNAYLLIEFLTYFLLKIPLSWTLTLEMEVISNPAIYTSFRFSDKRI